MTQEDRTSWRELQNTYYRVPLAGDATKGVGKGAVGAKAKAKAKGVGPKAKAKAKAKCNPANDYS